MKHYKYLIIGGGLAGDAATRGIRELDAQGSIGLISMEPDAPYMRPNLSKGLWKGRPVEKIWRKTEERAELTLGRKVTAFDPQNKSVRDDKGDLYSYDKLLLAMGGSPVRLPFGADDIIYFRDFRDYQRLRAQADAKQHFVIIGGGFIGSEIAAALTMVGKKVTMIFPEDAIGANIYPTDLAHFLNDYYRGKGVELITKDTVADIQKDGERFIIRTRGGRAIETDGVVAGIGIRPNLELPQQLVRQTAPRSIVLGRRGAEMGLVINLGDGERFTLLLDAALLVHLLPPPTPSSDHSSNWSRGRHST